MGQGNVKEMKYDVLDMRIRCYEARKRLVPILAVSATFLAVIIMMLFLVEINKLESNIFRYFLILFQLVIVATLGYFMMGLIRMTKRELEEVKSAIDEYREKVNKGMKDNNDESVDYRMKNTNVLFDIERIKEEKKVIGGRYAMYIIHVLILAFLFIFVLDYYYDAMEGNLILSVGCLAGVWLVRLFLNSMEDKKIKEIDGVLREKIEELQDTLNGR